MSFCVKVPCAEGQYRRGLVRSVNAGSKVRMSIDEVTCQVRGRIYISFPLTECRVTLDGEEFLNAHDKKS